MTHAELAAELLEIYPALAGLSPGLLDAVLAEAQRVSVPRGAQLFAAGAECRHFPLVLAGSIRVAKTAEDRELQLYRVAPGESCVLTSSCLVGHSAYPASGVAETDVHLALLPRSLFERLMAEHAPFRRYVFGLFAERLADLMGLVEAVAFHKLDRRLAAALLGHGPHLELTHQQLADEVGSVREIVTRVLRSFADHGLVRLGRGSIEILDAPGLRQVASGS